jgi:hypothetical protein
MKSTITRRVGASSLALLLGIGVKARLSWSEGQRKNLGWRNQYANGKGLTDLPCAKEGESYTRQL